MDSSVLGGLIGGLAGLVGFSFGVYAMLHWGLGMFQYMGGKKKSSLLPLSPQHLEERLMALNSPDAPYEIKKVAETDFMVEWKIADAKWFAFLTRERLRQVYRGFLVVDEPRRAVRYCEELVSVRWLADGKNSPSFVYQKNFFRGRILFQKTWEVGYGIKDGGSFGKVYEVRFDVNHVRGPVEKVVRESGWEFVPVVRKSHATYKSLKS